MFQALDPIDELLFMAKDAMAGTAKKDDKSKATAPGIRSEQRKKELDMWHTWNNKGRKPEHLKPLLTSFKPLIESEARRWRGKVEIPSSAIDHEFNKQFVNAVKSFNPKAGNLHSWVGTHLRKAGRFVRTYQNFGKIPEPNISLITPYKRAVADLTDKFGHEPDTHAIAAHMKQPVKKIVQLQKEMSRKDLPLSGYGAKNPTSKDTDPAEFLNSKELEAIRLIQYEPSLTPEHKVVYEYTFGLNGKPTLRPTEISKKTGIHVSKISRIREDLRQKVQEAMKVL